MVLGSESAIGIHYYDFETFTKWVIVNIIGFMTHLDADRKCKEMTSFPKTVVQHITWKQCLLEEVAICVLVR